MFRNNIWLSCTGASATLTLTYDSCNRGIAAGNSAILASPGYAVSVTTVDNGNGTYTSTYTVTHTGLLNGQFTINDGGDKVRFSQGNLRYLSDLYAGRGTWSFAPNQYSIIGNAENNTHPTTATNGESMDLFCWGATGIPNLGDLGNPTPLPDADPDDHPYPPYYYTGNNNLSGLYEWGNVTISNTTLTTAGWRTLTKEEWEYLFSDNAKYGPATVAGCAGVILLPDSFSDPKKNGGSGAFKNASEATEYSHNVYSAENWKAMEYAGAVFLPAAGTNFGGTPSYVGDWGTYWSSTYSGDNDAYHLVFFRNVVDVNDGLTDNTINRNTRMSVRLVRTGD